MMKDSGLTVFVGNPKKSDIQYYVKDTIEVLNFLRLIIEARHTPENLRICWGPYV
jgi:hypothetical protein